MCSDMAEKLSLSLRWGSHQETVLHSLETSFGAQDFVDLTLACEGQSVQAHKVVVSACSSFIKKLLQDHPCPHPIIILKDISMSQLKQLLEFMYSGQVIVEQQQLESLLQAAQVLGVRGLTDVDSSDSAHSMASYGFTGEESNHSKTDNTTKSKNVTLPGNKSILASYLTTPTSTKSLSLAELLSQPALNTNPEAPVEEQDNKGSSTGSVSEIDFEVKQEEIDLGIDSEFHDTPNIDPPTDLVNNLDQGSKGIGKATAFMLTLAKRANRVAALPYPTNRPSIEFEQDPLNEGKSCLLCGQTFRDDMALALHARNCHSGHSRSEDSTGEQKLAFYESRPCSVCGKMYRDAASLRTHMSIMHTIWRDGFECSCKQVFDTKYEMYQHRKSHGKTARPWMPAT